MLSTMNGSCELPKSIVLFILEESWPDIACIQPRNLVPTGNSRGDGSIPNVFRYLGDIGEPGPKFDIGNTGVDIY